MIPKIDTHRHLGGSIPIRWVWRIIRELDLDIAKNYDDVVQAMSFTAQEDRDFYRFLSKFAILNHIPWTEDLIADSIKSVCDELAAENIDYCWLDFSINKYMNSHKWNKTEAIEFIYDCFKHFRPGGVGLILSLKYEDAKANQQQYASLIEDPKAAEKLIGIDLVGDERKFDYRFYLPIFRQWRSASKIVRAHVAESQRAENGLHAILHLGATNIAHGLKMTRFPDMMQIARDHGVTFDLGLTSNILTGVLNDSQSHPVMTMLETGQLVTLGTDDPVQCSTTLDEEFQLVRQYGATNEQCQKMKERAYYNSRTIFQRREYVKRTTL